MKLDSVNADSMADEFWALDSEESASGRFVKFLSLSVFNT